MKVIIKKVSLRNFLSVGSKWLDVNFDKGLCRVTGENLDNNTRNGCGKSTLLCDSLMFGLFGKPLRKISLSDLPNTVNYKKGCEVKVFLQIENKQYMIHRGISPSFLKLYENYSDGDEHKKNNEDEKQDSAKKFTQKRIDDLLKASYTTFSHILIMSNTYSAPFLDLDKTKKREVIESILGVTIFGDMNDLAKEISLNLKSDMKIFEKEFELKSNNVTTMEENIKILKQKADHFEKIKKTKKNKLKSEMNVINEKLQNIEQLNEEEINNKLLLFKKHEKRLNEQLTIIKTEIKNFKKQKIEFTQTLTQLMDKPTCPVCGTETNSEHVKEHIDSLVQSVETCDSTINKLNDDTNDIINKLEQIEEKTFNQEKLLQKCRKNLILTQQLIEQKDKIKISIKDLLEEKNNFKDLINENELIQKQEELVRIKDKLNETSEDRTYYEYIRNMLSNDGIKNYIIKKILKFWNSKVNFYLREMNAEFSILFDETLEAKIFSRNQVPLSYHSFSGGEKARIDVSILLSIIDISKLQNSIDLNIMVIDELLDGGLDDNGREDVLYLFKHMVEKQDKSIYVISHNNNLPAEVFDKEITIYKKDGFTYI